MEIKMRHISEKDYIDRMDKIRNDNIMRQRNQDLKQERRKYNPSFQFFYRMPTSNKMLAAIIFNIIWFTLVCLFIQFYSGIEVSSTLITLWFSFWTVEVVALAGIKVSKVLKRPEIESEGEIDGSDSVENNDENNNNNEEEI